MDKIDGNYLSQGGNDFPLDCETFDNIQNNLHMTEILGNIGGPKLFLTGCNKSGNTYTAGYVFVRTTAYPDGEVLRWPGGTVTNNTVYIATSNTAVTANGTEYPAAYTTRVLTATNPGASAESFNFAEFVHVDDNKPLYGEIKMFAGPISKIPSNYKLCDGTALNKDDYPLLYAVIGDMYNLSPMSNEQSTTVLNYSSPPPGYFRLPDLKARFIVGYCPTTTNNNHKYEMVNVGGDSDVKLIDSQCALPSHGHQGQAVTDPAGEHYHGTWGESFARETPYGIYSTSKTWGSNGGYDRDNYTYKTSTDGSHQHYVKLDISEFSQPAASQSHENRPPYYVMAYIIRVK